MLDPQRIAHELNLPLVDLVLALTFLVEGGYLKRLLRVRPRTTHTLLQQNFERFEDIPDELYDDNNVVFALEDADVIPVYRETEA